MSAPSTPGSRFEAGGRLLWPIFAPMAGWIGAQQAGFLLDHWVCRTGHRWVPLLATALALLVAAASAAFAWPRWRGARSAAALEGESSGTRFLAAAGVVTGAFFFLATLALAVPELMHRPCD